MPDNEHTVAMTIEVTANLAFIATGACEDRRQDEEDVERDVSAILAREYGEGTRFRIAALSIDGKPLGSGLWMNAEEE